MSVHGKTRLIFSPPLVEGVVLSRPNRFVMVVRTKDEILRCHCPTTGRLGSIKPAGIACLFSRASESRKTQGTVEAVSVDALKKREKNWVGINQTMVNRYVEFFLKSGQLRRMVLGEVKREVKVGSSRIDFKVGETYLEVKTPLTSLPGREYAETIEHRRFTSFDRLIKHMVALMRVAGGGTRAIIAMCYLYDAKRFRPPTEDRFNERILEIAKSAQGGGVETWQINLRIDREGVSLIRYFKNVLF